MQFVLNLLNSIVSAIGAGIGVSIADRCPRRPLLIWGTLFAAVRFVVLCDTFGRADSSPPGYARHKRSGFLALHVF